MNRFIFFLIFLSSLLFTLPCICGEDLSLDEATKLAQEFFGSHFGMCGGLREAIKDDEYWSFSFVEGYSGKPSPNLIRVNIHTGYVSMKGNDNEKLSSKRHRVNEPDIGEIVKEAFDQKFGVQQLLDPVVER